MQSRWRSARVQVLGGDLEAVKDEACAADVELIGCEADDHFVEGILQGALVGGWGEVEASAGAAGVGIGDGATVGVVEVAEGFAAEGGGAAAVGVGEEVVAEWCGHGVGASPRVLFGVRSRWERA